MKKVPLHLILVLCVYLLSFLFVSPFYEYPVGDDWAYSKVAKLFYETGTFQTLSWYGQSLIFQIVWCFLFLLPFGFSFSALHLSNAVMGILAVLFFDCLLASLHFQKKERFLGCLLLVISPPFVFLSRTFHTDLPFLALYLGAAWAYIQGLSRRSGPWLLAGSLFLGLSVLVRQVGIFLPLILFFVLIRDRKDFSLWQRFTPLVPFLTLGLFTLWQHDYFHGIPPANLLLATYALRIDKILADSLRIPFSMFLYFGYYLSPILVPCGLSLWVKRDDHPVRWRLFLLGGVAFGIAILFLGLGKGLWMPEYFPRGFHLKGAGLFPHIFVTLCGVAGGASFAAVYYQRIMMHLDTKRMSRAFVFLLCVILGLALPPIRSILLSMGRSLLPILHGFFAERISLYQTLETWQAQLPRLYHHALLSLSWIFCIGSCLFVIIPSLMRGEKEDTPLVLIERPERIFHGASFLYLLFLLFMPVTTDRYLFPIFPSAILLTLRMGRLIPYSKIGSSLLIFCVLVPSLLHTDRIIQRVGGLWEGGDWLLSQGIPPERLDAGFVFNGWHLYVQRKKEGFEGTDKGWREKGWWVTDDEYRVSTHLPEGYKIIRQIAYRDLLTPLRDSVYVGKRR